LQRKKNIYAIYGIFPSGVSIRKTIIEPNMKTYIPISILITIIISITGLSAQERPESVSGIIIDSETEEPIIGATALWKGATSGAMTNLDGEYMLNISDGNNILVANFIGYHPKEVYVTEARTVNIALEEDKSFDHYNPYPCPKKKELSVPQLKVYQLNIPQPLDKIINQNKL